MSEDNVPAAVPDKAEAPASAPDTPLSRLTARLADIIKQSGHSEMWGVELSSDASHAPTQVVLQKFLRANNGDVAGAEKQLGAALAWRQKWQPTKLVSQAFSKDKFGGLGFVTNHKDDAGNSTVITWNIYGAVKDNKATFGDVNEFIKWRTALMELGVQQLHLNDIKEPLPEDGTDKHQMLQVHDYKSVSFFRMDPAVKAASKETISVFSTAYPELLAHKYFVNVPTIMGWMFGAMKLFLAPATLKKFHPMASGASLATELKSIASSLPQEYGGSGAPVQQGLTVTLVDAAETAKEEILASPEPETAAAPSAAAPAPARVSEVAVETVAAAPQTAVLPVRPKEDEETPAEPKKDDTPAIAAEPEVNVVKGKVADEQAAEKTPAEEESKPEAETEGTPAAADAAPKASEAAPKEIETTETAETAQPAKTA
ncbi:CRAL/TRIO domain-containing protein [Trichoderma longibrachiatum ATCC 18648]|uniref:Phosphatidylinositol transfer protein SFH5 n=1 Tax=Trichoderma longibrachiatum ATCC 18648 TaxID=983965 RepID=A0A2T4CES4_TRILO|nr:CRAL/TRIO domain-containing protein [Trichoderma longibrachiatum ATCC 18648]